MLLVVVKPPSIITNSERRPVQPVLLGRYGLGLGLGQIDSHLRSPWKAWGNPDPAGTRSAYTDRVPVAYRIKCGIAVCEGSASVQ
jgi:hypothetical protein